MLIVAKSLRNENRSLFKIQILYFSIVSILFNNTYSIFIYFRNLTAVQVLRFLRYTIKKVIEVICDKLLEKIILIELPHYK